MSKQQSKTKKRVINTSTGKLRQGAIRIRVQIKFHIQIRYADGVLSFNNPKFDDYVDVIYPSEFRFYFTSIITPTKCYI